MTWPSGDIRARAEKAGVPEWLWADFVVNVHMKSQYIPEEQAIQSVIGELYRVTSDTHPTQLKTGSK